MGREIKRVPLDFSWPLDKVWEGFINPLYKPCPEAGKNKCHGGYTNAGKWLDSIGRLIALIGEQAVDEPIAEQLRARGQTYPHPYLENWEQAPHIEPPRELIEQMREKDRTTSYRMLQQWSNGLTTRLIGFGGDEMIALVTALADGKKPHRMQGSNYAWSIEKALRTAANLPEDWGICKICEGHAMDPAIRDAYESWERIQPPEGEGWQLWETVSEGSPVSPVFATKEEFIEYLISQGYSKLAAEKFSEIGWAPSMISTGDGHIYRDIESAAILGS